MKNKKGKIKSKKTKRSEKKKQWLQLKKMHFSKYIKNKTSL